MTKRIRVQSVKALGAAALVAQVFIFQACGGSNSPSSTPGSGGNNSTGTAGNNSTGTAGTTGVGGTTGTGGSTSTGGTGGSAGGTTGTGGSTATAGNACGMGFGLPACASTVSKGGTCAPTDVQCCYKTCGPEKAGVKSEICQTSGSYSEMSGCAFDDTKDYSAYKIPATANTTCPTDATTGAYTVPKGSDPCTVDHGVVCNDQGGVAGGNYSDSGGAVKPGYCVCQLPNTSGARLWSCASDTAWPCPGHTGC